MSQVIKFRGQRKDNKKWVYGSLVQYWFLGESITGIVDERLEHKEYDRMPFNQRLVPIVPSTVGQFISLKDDKNDQEIYAGDEVMATTRGKIFVTKPGIVKFHRGGFVINLYSEDIDDAKLAYDYYELELTGKNIHENPELLK